MRKLLVHLDNGEVRELSSVVRWRRTLRGFSARHADGERCYIPARHVIMFRIMAEQDEHPHGFGAETPPTDN